MIKTLKISLVCVIVVLRCSRKIFKDGRNKGPNNSIAPSDLTLKNYAVNTTSFNTPSMSTLLTDLKICSAVNF